MDTSALPLESCKHRMANSILSVALYFHEEFLSPLSLLPLQRQKLLRVLFQRSSDDRLCCWKCASSGCLQKNVFLFATANCAWILQIHIIHQSGNSASALFSQINSFSFDILVVSFFCLLFLWNKVKTFCERTISVQILFKTFYKINENRLKCLFCKFDKERDQLLKKILTIVLLFWQRKG